MVHCEASTPTSCNTSESIQFSNFFFKLWSIWWLFLIHFCDERVENGHKHIEKYLSSLFFLTSYSSFEKWPSFLKDQWVQQSLMQEWCTCIEPFLLYDKCKANVRRHSCIQVNLGWIFSICILVITLKYSYHFIYCNGEKTWKHLPW